MINFTPNFRLCFTAIILIVLFSECVKKERIPWNDDRISIDYKNEFKHDAQPFDQADLSYVASVDSNSITLTDLSLAEKYPINSCIVAPPNLIEFDSINIMRRVIHIDTIGNSLKLITREANPLEIFNGYNLATVTADDINYTMPATRSACDNGNYQGYIQYDFDPCAYIKPSGAFNDYICRNKEVKGTFPTNTIRINANYKFDLEVSYTYTATTCVKDRQIPDNPNSFLNWPTTTEYLGRIQSEIITTSKIEWDVKVKVTQAGVTDNTERELWKWEPTPVKYKIPTLVGPVDLEIGLEGELKSLVSKKSGTGGLKITKSWEERIFEVTDVWGVVDNYMGRTHVGIHKRNVPGLTKKEETFDGELSYDPYFNLELGAAKQIEGHLYVFGKASWWKAGKASLLEAKLECGPYLKISAVKPGPVGGNTFGFDCGVELGLDLKASVGLLNIDDVSLFKYEHDINGFPIKWIDWKLCDWITTNPFSEVSANFFSYDISNCGKSVSKIFVYETNGGDFTSNPVANVQCNVGYGDGKLNDFIDGTIHPPSGFTETLVYNTNVQGEPVDTAGLKEFQNIPLDFDKSYVVFVVDLQTYIDNYTLFFNTNGNSITSLANQLDTKVGSYGHYGYTYFDLPYRLPQNPKAVAVQVSLRGNGTIR